MISSGRIESRPFGEWTDYLVKNVVLALLRAPAVQIAGMKNQVRLVAQDFLHYLPMDFGVAAGVAINGQPGFSTAKDEYDNAEQDYQPRSSWFSYEDQFFFVVLVVFHFIPGFQTLLNPFPALPFPRIPSLPFPGLVGFLKSLKVYPGVLFPVRIA